MEYAIVKWLHVLSSTLLFGTGLGSAFYMLVVSRTRDAHAIAVVARYVVIADWAFTTPTVIIQPLTGFYLAHLRWWVALGIVAFLALVAVFYLMVAKRFP